MDTLCTGCAGHVSYDTLKNGSCTLLLVYMPAGYSSEHHLVSNRCTAAGVAGVTAASLRAVLHVHLSTRLGAECAVWCCACEVQLDYIVERSAQVLWPAVRVCLSVTPCLCMQCLCGACAHASVHS